MSFFKTKEIEKRSEYMCANIQALMYTMFAYLLKQTMVTGIELNPTVTETVTTEDEDKKLNRVSSSHREGRAFDLRCKDWPEEIKEEFKEFFNKSFGHMGAISATSKQKNLIVHHGEGENEHFHVQIAKSYKNDIRLAEFNNYIKNKIVT